MKKHIFKEHNHTFGSVLDKCVKCGAISFDNNFAPFTDDGEWWVISNDCNIAAKQIEVFELRRNKK